MLTATNLYYSAFLTWCTLRVVPLTFGTFRGSNPGVDGIFSTRPDRSWDTPSVLRDGYRVSCLGVKRPGRGVTTHPHLVPRLKKG